MRYHAVMIIPVALTSLVAMAHAVAKADIAVMAQLTAVKAACSEFGFCGTTKDFCGDKCQSNCVLHPKPPGGSATGKTLSKVIGYYEAWNARSKCHGTVPSDLPISALTHLNYAFAFIDPSTFELTTMDAATPVSLFNDIAALKDIKPSLQIYISVGGWTFSDNNTATQPVFGNIARSPENREKFANNALAFLNQYGFDGIDIDWEYPGAPDRGGHKDDTKNYVEMMKTLRQVFDKSGRKLGITFTGPSSFWYMRWFDLPGLLKYADWMNLMSYDLHGVGSIAQAHTNLTEIKLAAELLWRVKVDPSQVALGFGFYGRAFTLQDPGCTDPGCPFIAGADPGVCTGTSGYLAHYEIQEILSKDGNVRALANGDIKVFHDETAAVKYFTWNKDQWISYDDADTFKQKVDWANTHKAITGENDIKSASDIKKSEEIKPLPKDAADELNGSFTRKCYKLPDIVDLRNPQASACDPGFTKVGYDRATSDGKDSIAVFNYLNDAVLRDYLDKARAQLLREITYTDAHAQGLKGILDIWLEFEPAYYANAVANAHNFVVETARIINARFPTGAVDGNKAAAILVTTANQLIKSVYQIKFNPNE
ncbi:Bacteriodes thetaiotaomicron symbiotic chitinase [Trichophyton interdigitale]|nr:Bacteriodes thetaiotaomicron symbiotic chitinase [Trichophyton interdigitale]KAG8212384.1 Bacteriodes thetaiotaomicron symbiotic chitinase [Trichophyton interdigitale]